MEDAALSECSVSVKRHGEDARVSAHQNEKEEWELDLYEGVVLPDGFKFEVTLPQFHRLQVLKIRTKGIQTIPEDINNLKNVTSLMLLYGDLEGFPSAVCQLDKLTA